MDSLRLFHSKPPRCRLLGLPAEIRDHIYQYVLHSEKPLVSFRLDEYQRQSYTEATQPALTYVSRQVREESLPVFYRCNTIALHTESPKYDETQAWLQCIDPHIPKIQRLAVWTRYRPSGAISVTMERSLAQPEWRVSDDFRWITVNRPPRGLETEGRLLVIMLRLALRAEKGSKCETARYLSAVLDALRTAYENEKGVAGE